MKAEPTKPFRPPCLGFAGTTGNLATEHGRDTCALRNARAMFRGVLLHYQLPGPFLLCGQPLCQPRVL